MDMVTHHCDAGGQVQVLQQPLVVLYIQPHLKKPQDDMHRCNLRCRHDLLPLSEKRIIHKCQTDKDFCRILYNFCFFMAA